MIGSKAQQSGLLAVIFALVLVVGLPTLVNAQGRGRGRGQDKKADKFINGHDARDGRFDGRGPRRDRDDRFDDDDDYYDRGSRRRDRDDDNYYRRSRRRDRDDDDYYRRSSRRRHRDDAYIYGRRRRSEILQRITERELQRRRLLRERRLRLGL